MERASQPLDLSIDFGAAYMTAAAHLGLKTGLYGGGGVEVNISIMEVDSEIKPCFEQALI